MESKNKKFSRTRKTGEVEQRAFALDLVKEREPWRIQYAQLQFKEAHALHDRKQELMSQIEKQKLAQELAVQMQLQGYALKWKND